MADKDTKDTKEDDSKLADYEDKLADYEKRVIAMDAKINDLLGEKKDEAKKRKAAEKEAARITAEKAVKDGDVEAVTESWQKKYDTDMAAANEAKDDALKMLRLEKVHSKAVELATTLAVPGSADVLLPHIESRLSMDIKDGRAVAVVMDAQGKPSALTVDELGKEIANNAAFAPLIVASNAAGGGANGTQRGGAAKSKTVTKAQWGDMNPKQKMEFSKDGGQVTET
jgi:Tfp pilus assembly major pilin PilA